MTDHGGYLNCPPSSRRQSTTTEPGLGFFVGRPARLKFFVPESFERDYVGGTLSLCTSLTGVIFVSMKICLIKGAIA